MRRLVLLSSGLVLALNGTGSIGAEVMREGQVTESALIEALTPPSALPGKTRSIRLQRTEEAARVTTQPTTASKPSASVLITFRTNSATLTPDARQALDVVGRALQSDRLAEFRFAIEGHADPRGSSDVNLKLSQERAEAVRRYLLEAHGLDESRLRPIGKGDREPLNPSNPAAPENRRVTFVTLPG